jgi:predicted nucleic acid-binding Zn ribbon protein
MARNAVGPIDVVRWPTAHLHDLRQRNPTLWSKIQSAIGHDLVEKIRRVEPLHSAVREAGG